MSNFLEEGIKEALKFVDRAYREGWMWYVLGVLLLLFVIMMFFARANVDIFKQ